MDLSRAPQRTPTTVEARAEAGLVAFLLARVSEDLARLWAREQRGVDGVRRPGPVSQLAVLDELLLILRDGRLPVVGELRMLLFGYSLHPDYDPRWPELLGR